ncbi:MAG: hypothetical protein VX438_13345, partial [Planctomycetota bacterium]|nr:hypothetical protein [Planctomycetota bacterium]
MRFLLGFLRGGHMESSGTAICFRWCGPKCIPRTYQELIHGEWIDRNPLPVQCEFQEDGLWVSYSYQESLRIVVPWEISDLGIFFLKTVTLPKSKGPYDLVLELARGTVGRLVDQAENWKASGLVLSGTIEKQLQLVKLNFRRAAFSDGEERYQ